MPPQDLLNFVVGANISQYNQATQLAQKIIEAGHDEFLHGNGISQIARLIMQANKDVEFHFVSYKALKEGGDNFIKQFDAFINEGTMDVSYPESTEFTTNNYSFSTPTEQLYQLILKKTDELKIPYLGICGSAHALSLYHQGAVAPIKGYGNNQHDIEFIKGTVPYFLSLSSQQQEQALKKGTFRIRQKITLLTFLGISYMAYFTGLLEPCDKFFYPFFSK